MSMDNDSVDDKRIAFGTSVKALGDSRVGGYLVKFTNENRRDLYAEWFDANTDFKFEGFPVKAKPTLFHHGLDETLGAEVIGKIDKERVDDEGIWVEAILDEHAAYVDDIKRLVEKGILGWSSGALPQAVRVADTGHIDVWPIIEASLTHTPAMPGDTRITSIRSLKPTALREAASKQLREVTVKTDGGAVAKVSIEYGPDKPNTHTHTGETDVKELGERLTKAVKMLDEETRNEIIELVQETVSMAMEEYKAEGGELDEESMNAADEAVADALEEEVAKAADDEEEGDVKSFVAKPQFTQAIVSAWVRGYVEAESKRQDNRREVIRQAMNESKRNAPGISKKEQVGGYHSSNLGKGSGVNISVGEERRYAHLTPEQMALGVKMMVAGLPDYLKERADANELPLNEVARESYARHAAHKIAAKIDGGAIKDAGDALLLRDLAGIKSFKADEINAGDITGQGLEWVTTYYDTTLWQRVRDDTKLFELMAARDMRQKEIPKGASSVQFQIDTSSGTVYHRQQANDLNAINTVETTAYPTAFGTGNVTVTGQEHVIANVVTDRLDETSVINVLQHADSDMLTTLAEAIEDALINGDTTSDTTNINHDGAALQTAPQVELWRAWNGLRHHWLIDNTSLGSDHATGALAATTFLDTRDLLPGRVRNRRQNLLFVMDYGTEAKARRIAELFTRDVAYNDASFFTGVLPPIDGVDVYTSGFLRSADTDGKVTDGGNVTDTGTLMCIYAPYWAYANQRAVNIETARGWTGASSGSTLLVATVVHGFSARSANAASGTYNISIA